MIKDFLIKYLVIFACCGMIAFISHELGHFFMAGLLGHKLKMSFKISMLLKIIPIPRYVWANPIGISKLQLRMIHIAGFGLEIALIPFAIYNFQIYAIHYSTVVFFHFILYPFYAGHYNDFKYLN